MIHAESVKQWEAEVETYRRIIGELRAEIEQLRRALQDVADEEHAYGPIDPYKIARDALGDYKDPWSRGKGHE